MTGHVIALLLPQQQNTTKEVVCVIIALKAVSPEGSSEGFPRIKQLTLLLRFVKFPDSLRTFLGSLYRCEKAVLQLHDL